MSKYQPPFYGPFQVTLHYGKKGSTWACGYHSGIDLVSIAAGGDGLVRSIAVGKVIRAVRGHASYGNYVTVQHDDGFVSLYAHLSSVAVEAGQRVRPGDILGTEGSTGNVTGRHLHIEIHKGEYRYPSKLDPTHYIQALDAGCFIPPDDPGSVPDGYAVEAVSWAIQNGILRGDTSGRLHLREPLTRQDAIVLLHRLWME